MRTPACLCVALLLAACQPAPQPHHLVVATDAPVKDIDPRLATDGPSARLSRMVFRGLTQVGDHGDPSLDLAAEITAVAPLRVRVTLRRDGFFHDGRRVTAADVAFTYQTTMDPAFGTPIGGEFRRRFAAVRADEHNDAVVWFELRRPLATLLTDLVLGIAPAHALATVADRRFHGQVIGNGPWRVDGIANGEHVTLRRAGPGAGVQALTFRAIGDEGARALSVLGGGADVAWTGMSPAVLAGAARTGRARLQSADGIALTYLGFNLRKTPFDQPAVRRALALGIDRPAVIATLLGGLARPADGLFAPGHWARADLPQLPFDPAQAQRLLDQAGLQPDATGIRLRVELKVSTSRLRRQLARALADQWRQIGVDAQVRPFELSTFLADVRAGRFEMFMLQLPEPFEPDQLAWMLHSQNAAVKTADLAAPSAYARIDRHGLSPSVWATELQADPACAAWQHRKLREGLEGWLLQSLGGGGNPGSANRTGYADPWVDCWLDLGGAELDRGKRRDLYALAQQQVARDLPIAPLWWEHQAVLVGPRVAQMPLYADGRYLGVGEALVGEH